MPAAIDLRDRLKAARRRAAQATPGGPEWDAATAEIDEVETYLRRLHGRTKAAPRSQAVVRASS